MSELEGRAVVVTGAARGIGRAVGLACAREGAEVGIGYLNSARQAEELQREIRERFDLDSHLLRFAVEDRDQVSAAVGRFCELSGRLDGWVNCAAIHHPDLLLAASPERIEQQIAVNLKGTILGVQAALRVLLAQRSGVVVNVSSVAAVRPGRGQAVYAATKGAVESLTRALAVEYGRKGIRFHCVRPGAIDTEMLDAVKRMAGDELLARVPLRRLGRPEEVAEMVVFLLSERAAFITGSTQTVDGGYLQG